GLGSAGGHWRRWRSGRAAAIATARGSRCPGAGAVAAFQSAGAGCLWCDVLVDVEEVAGVVGPLDLNQPVVVLAVVVPDLVVIVVLHEVDVAARLRVRR